MLNESSKKMEASNSSRQELKSIRYFKCVTFCHDILKSTNIKKICTFSLFSCQSSEFIFTAQRYFQSDRCFNKNFVYFRKDSGRICVSYLCSCRDCFPTLENRKFIKLFFSLPNDHIGIRCVGRFPIDCHCLPTKNCRVGNVSNDLCNYTHIANVSVILIQGSLAFLDWPCGKPYYPL